MADKGDLDSFYESMRWLIDGFLRAIKERDQKIQATKDVLEEIANMRITDCDAYDTAANMKQLAKEAVHEIDKY